MSSWRGLSEKAWGEVTSGAHRNRRRNIKLTALSGTGEGHILLKQIPATGAIDYRGPIFNNLHKDIGSISRKASIVGPTSRNGRSHV